MCKRPDIRCGNTHQPRFRLSPRISLGGRIQNEVFLDRHSNGFSLILANGVEVYYAQAAIRIPMRGWACCPLLQHANKTRIVTCCCGICSSSRKTRRAIVTWRSALGSWIAIFEHMRNEDHFGTVARFTVRC